MERRKTIVYNYTPGSIFKPSIEYFEEEGLEIESSLTELYANVLKSNEDLDIYFLSHGFEELIGDDYIDADFNIESFIKNKINSIIGVLEKVGETNSIDSKIKNLFFIACNTNHIVESKGRIERIITYSKSIDYFDLIEVSKLAYKYLSDDDSNNPMTDFRSELEKLNGIDINAIRTTP